MEINRVGTFTLGWGESLTWDERRRRLYFVDCAARMLHWLDDGATEPEAFELPTMGTGIVLTETSRLVVVLEDGLYVFDPDARDAELLSRFPEAIGGRCNDACADPTGNIITGKLNLGPAEGSAWQFSTARGWSLLDPDIANTNGPAVLEIDGALTLIIGDSSRDYFAYDYDPATATVGPRRVFGDTTMHKGHPDGSAVDADGGLWCALVGGGELVRFSPEGLDTSIPLPVENPTDVAFAGVDLATLYVTTIGGRGELDGALLRIDGIGPAGRLEPRAHLAG